MKHTFKFLNKLGLICLVVMITFVSPAVMASIVLWDKFVYLNVITSPEYCVIMFIVTLFVVIGYVDYIISKNNGTDC